MSFKDALTKLHLVEDESPLAPVSTPAPAAHPQAAPPGYVTPTYAASGPSGPWPPVSAPIVGAPWQQAPSDPDMVNKIKASVFGASPFILKGVLPIAMPRIFDAVIVSTSILWTYITVSEYVNADSGLGQMIQNAKRFSAMDQVFAGIIVIIGLALITNVTLTYLKKRIYFWEGTQ